MGKFAASRHQIHTYWQQIGTELDTPPTRYPRRRNEHRELRPQLFTRSISLKSMPTLRRRPEASSEGPFPFLSPFLYYTFCGFFYFLSVGHRKGLGVRLGVVLLYHSEMKGCVCVCVYACLCASACGAACVCWVLYWHSYRDILE